MSCLLPTRISYIVPAGCCNSIAAAVALLLVPVGTQTTVWGPTRLEFCHGVWKQCLSAKLRQLLGAGCEQYGNKDAVFRAAVAATRGETHQKHRHLLQMLLSRKCCCPYIAVLLAIAAAQLPLLLCTETLLCTLALLASALCNCCCASCPVQSLPLRLLATACCATLHC